MVSFLPRLVTVVAVVCLCVFLVSFSAFLVVFHVCMLFSECQFTTPEFEQLEFNTVFTERERVLTIIYNLHKYKQILAICCALGSDPHLPYEWDGCP